MENDTTFRDILEEEERRSIRSTLELISNTAFRADQARQSISVDPYRREASIWVRTGMRWEHAKRNIESMLGLSCVDKADAIVCPTPGSNRYSALRVVVEEGRVLRVSFDE